MKTYKKKDKDTLTKDVETPKLKRIDIPPAAKAKINLANQEINNYLSGVVVGMGIKGRWSLDMQKMQIVVEDK